MEMFEASLLYTSPSLWCRSRAGFPHDSQSPKEKSLLARSLAVPRRALRPFQEVLSGPHAPRFPCRCIPDPPCRSPGSLLHLIERAPLVVGEPVVEDRPLGVAIDVGAFAVVDRHHGGLGVLRAEPSHFHQRAREPVGADPLRGAVGKAERDDVGRGHGFTSGFGMRPASKNWMNS